MVATWLVERIIVFRKTLEAKRAEARFIKRVDKALRNPYLNPQDKEMLRDSMKQIEIDNIESLAAKLKRSISDLNNHS